MKNVLNLFAYNRTMLYICNTFTSKTAVKLSKNKHTNKHVHI